jgi:hypothetical protein
MFVLIGGTTTDMMDIGQPWATCVCGKGAYSSKNGADDRLLAAYMRGVGLDQRGEGELHLPIQVVREEMAVKDIAYSGHSLYLRLANKDMQQRRKQLRKKPTGGAARRVASIVPQAKDWCGWVAGWPTVRVIGESMDVLPDSQRPATMPLWPSPLHVAVTACMRYPWTSSGPGYGRPFGRHLCRVEP